MKIGSLFSGIGGLELGLERAGVGRTVWQVEQSEFCRQVLAKHWPDATRYEDVTSTDWSTVEPVDVICGGFPCPPFSSAGLKRGMLDDRWLWPAFADCIRVVRPRYVVVENVADLLTDPAFGVVLADLHSFGFDAEWSIVSACSVGASHMRERVFVLAHRQGDDGESDLPCDGTRPGSRLEHRGSRGGTWRQWWLSEPNVDRVAYGVPRKLVRPPLEAHGNAVVPQVAEVVGRRLMELAA